MALAGRRRPLRRSSADSAGWAVRQRRRQNDVWIAKRSDDLHAKPDRRNQVYRRITLVEFGFGQVHSGYDRYAERRCQQEED
jgi:hypothetical protein